jgi:hypothetical protein
MLQGNLLDNPKTEKVDREELQSQGTGLLAGAAGMQGWRLEMEVRILNKLSVNIIDILVNSGCPHSSRNASEE